MLGFIELLISSIGIYGVLCDNIICICIGLVGIIICDYIDIYVLGHNPTTIMLAIILALGASIATKSPLYTFTIALCGENFIMSLLTIILLLSSFLISKLKSKNFMVENNSSYVQLADIIKQGLDVSDTDEALSKTYEFYKEQGIDVDSIELDLSNKEKTLSLIVMLGIGTNDIEDAIAKTKKFYNIA